MIDVHKLFLQNPGIPKVTFISHHKLSSILEKHAFHESFFSFYNIKYFFDSSDNTEKTYFLKNYYYIYCSVLSKLFRIDLIKKFPFLESDKNIYQNRTYWTAFLKDVKILYLEIIDYMYSEPVKIFLSFLYQELTSQIPKFTNYNELITITRNLFLERMIVLQNLVKKSESKVNKENPKEVIFEEKQKDQDIITESKVINNDEIIRKQRNEQVETKISEKTQNKNLCFICKEKLESDKYKIIEFFKVTRNYVRDLGILEYFSIHNNPSFFTGKI